MEGSKKYQLNELDYRKIGKGFLIAMAGALVLWIPQCVEMVDWGAGTLIAGAIASTLVNALKTIYPG